MTDQPRSKGGFNLGDYVEVKDRIKLFYAAWPTGALVTGEVRISVDDDTPRVIVQALAYRTPDDPHPGVGWSWMVLPGSTTYTKGSELENTETSAWGRAIGALGIGIEKSIASKNEIDAKGGKPDEPSSVQSVEGGLIGIASLGKDDTPVDGQVRERPNGDDTVGFVLGEGNEKVQVVANGPLATALAPLIPSFLGQRVQVYGPVSIETMLVGPKKFPRKFPRLTLIQIKTEDFILPAPAPMPTVPIDDDLSGLPDEWAATA